MSHGIASTTQGSNKMGSVDLTPYSRLPVQDLQLPFGELCDKITILKRVQALLTIMSRNTSEESRDTAHNPLWRRSLAESVPSAITSMSAPILIMARGHSTNATTNDNDPAPTPTTHTDDTLYFLRLRQSKRTGKPCYEMHISHHQREGEGGDQSSLLSRTKSELEKELRNTEIYRHLGGKTSLSLANSAEPSVLVVYETPKWNVWESGSWISGKEIQQGKHKDRSIDDFARNVLQRLKEV